MTVHGTEKFLPGVELLISTSGVCMDHWRPCARWAFQPSQILTVSKTTLLRDDMSCEQSRLTQQLNDSIIIDAH